MDDDDSLLEKLDNEPVNEMEMDTEGESILENRNSSDVDEALDYIEEDLADDDRNASDHEEAGELVEEEKLPGKEEELEEGELEDGEIEDSDDDKEKSDGEISDNEKKFGKRARIQYDGSPNRQPIEMRLSRPERSRPAIRGIPPPPIYRNRQSSGSHGVAENSWEKGLMETKRLLQKASSIRLEDPDFETKRLLAAPVGEREYDRRPDEISSDEGGDRSTSPFYGTESRRRGKKDLGPQVIYPSREREREKKQQKMQTVQIQKAVKVERKPERVRKSSPLVVRKASLSPVARGISFSPTRDACPISSDSDSDAMQRKISKISSSRSSSSSSSTATFSRSSSVSVKSKSRSGSEKARKSRKTDNRSRRTSNNNEKRRSISSSDSESRSPKRRNRSSSATPSPSRFSKISSKNPRHMKRTRPTEVPSPRKRERTSSPPPYPPGMKPKESGKRGRKRSASSRSPPCGDISSFRIPKRNADSQRSRSDKWRSNNGENRQSKREERNGGKAKDKKMKKTAIEEISDSESSDQEKRTRRRTASSSSSSSASSISSKSASRSSSSDSSRSKTPELPAKYRNTRVSEDPPVSPPMKENHSARVKEEKFLKHVVSSPPAKRAKPVASYEVDDLDSIPPPPADDPVEIPPPAPPIIEEDEESGRKRKKRLKQELLAQLNRVESKLQGASSN